MVLTKCIMIWFDMIAKRITYNELRIYVDVQRHPIETRKKFKPVYYYLLSFSANYTWCLSSEQSMSWRQQVWYHFAFEYSRLGFDPWFLNKNQCLHWRLKTKVTKNKQTLGLLQFKYPLFLIFLDRWKKSSTHRVV